MNVNEETALIAFKAICNFINDLESEFGKRHKPLKLYKRLINQTQICHDKIIKKHITLFHDFSMNNRDALLNSDDSKLQHKRIAYSERVYIDMDYIFRLADKETKDVIWKHILTISAIVDPSSRAKDILKKSVEENKGTNEAEFLNNIISKVEQSVKPDANPMEAVSSIMQSGLFNELLNDLGSKKLDMGKLIGVVQGMVSNMSSQVGDNPEAKNAMGMLNNMVGSIGNMDNSNSTPGGMPGGMPGGLDMMSMMSTLMGGMMGGGMANKVEDVTKDLDKNN
jgi:hypothetical protein